MIIPSPTRSKFRKHTPILKQGTSLPERFLFLVLIIPVPVTEHEVRLAGQRKQRDLVQDRIQPQALDGVFDIAFVVVTACILCRGEFDFDLFRGF
jgi:hypothetical protein